MKRTIPIVVLTFAIVAFFAVNVPAVIINFDDGTNGNAIGNFYGGLGVTFSNAQWDDFVSIGEAGVGAGGLKLIDLGPTYAPKITSPIVGFFSAPVDFISIRGLNVGANGARIDAYNAAIGGTLVAFDQAFGTGVGGDNHPLLSVATAGILRMELYQPLSEITEGLLFDNLTFNFATVVPLPGTVWLLGLGLAGLLTARKKLTR